MATEVPIGFTADGELRTAFQFSEAEIADINMAGQLYAASPEAQERYRRVLDGLPSASIELSGYFDVD